MSEGTKLRRKVNQMYGRQMRDLIREQKKELDRQLDLKLANLESALKPKPKWIPGFIWEKLQDLVVKRDILW